MGHFVESRLPKFVPYFIKISLPWRWRRPTNKMRNRIVEKNINRHYNKITKTKIREKRGGGVERISLYLGSKKYFCNFCYYE